MKSNGPTRKPAASQTSSDPTSPPAADPDPTPRPVHFEYFDPAASRVAIAGTFNSWDPHAAEMNRISPGRWAKDLVLAPGTYEYRLVVDGRWLPDPAAVRTVPNPFGAPNSLLTVPAGSA